MWSNILKTKKITFYVCLVIITETLMTGCAPLISERKYYDKNKYHHTATGFRNPFGSPVRTADWVEFTTFLFWRFTNQIEPPDFPNNMMLKKNEVIKQIKTRPNTRKITWIGHSTFLINIDGSHILTDPIFSSRASPVSFAGPRRFLPPVINIKDLPQIDIILISHNHYDHMDKASLEKLALHSPEVTAIVPLGNASLIRKWGIRNVLEVDWYDRVKIGDVLITSTPAIHRSNRGLFDVNRSLWCGFIIEPKTPPNIKIWHAGDTGFGPTFQQKTRKKIGDIDIALVPIGAFLPRNIMKSVHVSPKEAVSLAKILGAEIVIPMHWGTFHLGDDKPLEAINRFKSTPANGIQKIIMKLGETKFIKDLVQSSETTH